MTQTLPTIADKRPLLYTYLKRSLNKALSFDTVRFGRSEISCFGA